MKVNHQLQEGRKPLAENKVSESPPGPRVAWLRTRGVRPLMAATLGLNLLLGGTFLAVDQLHAKPADALRPSGGSATDAQSRSQAVGAAQRIVTVAQLRATTAGYLLMSCKDADSPPYQGAVHLTFAIPSNARADTFLHTVAAALLADGWTEGLPPGGHPLAKTFTRDAVSAIIYRHDDDANLGVLRVYGECRNNNDHHSDATTWLDITGQLSLGR